MTQDIVGKLQCAISEPIRSEAVAVYVLVAIRKILEREGRKSDFETLVLFCDWVVHPHLSGRRAGQIVDLFDAYDNALNDDFRTAVDYRKLDDILSLSGLKQELALCLQSLGIDARNFIANEGWRSFTKQLLEILKDIPLEITASTQSLVSKVNLQAVAQSSDALTFKWFWDSPRSGLMSNIVRQIGS